MIGKLLPGAASVNTMNIVIAEPSRLYQAALENIFLPYVTCLDIVASGVKALEICSSKPVDLICVSYYLQDMDGIEFIAQIRKQPLGETIPILVITSKNTQELASNTIRNGATEIFHKENLAALEKYLSVFAEHARQQSQLSGNILFIHSDMAQAYEILEYFNKTRLHFVHFASADLAADMARVAEFDMVITNALLSGAMTSRALIREIREINDKMYRVPILAIIDTDNISHRLELLRAGANDSIHQPILMEELSIRVKNLLQNKKLFDIVEDQRQQLEDLAIRDQLTGLFNRHYLLSIIDKILQESSRHKYPLSLLVLDIDWFKRINDSLGHSYGDLVLQGLANLLKKSFRGSDTPVRYGGEEFIVLLPHCSLDDAYIRAENLRQQIMELKPADISVTVSIGVSQARMSGETDFDTLFAAADKALYRAKQSGRNCSKTTRDVEEEVFWDSTLPI